VRPERLLDADRDALLARIGVERATPSVSLLAELQRAWCFAQPFHNLDLLAAWRRGQGPLGPEAAVARCAAGLGGPCHVQSSAFLQLLLALGFDATHAGAAVVHEDDHLLVRTTIEGRVYYSDVGNGQPYLRPFPAHEPLRQEHLGWAVTSRPDGSGLLVERTSPDQPAPRRVYRASPTPRAWSHFAAAIDRHHREPGFGPFLTGLRAVRIAADVMITLRDDVLTRYAPDEHARSTLDPARIASVLEMDFGLAALPVEDALSAWRGATA
jgi:arylamine N-acetyltransferase